MLAAPCERRSVYAFEAIGDDLPFLPLAARRVLDVLGRKMSLDAWLSLPPGQRELLARAGTEARVDSAVLAVVDAAKPAPLAVPAVAEPAEAAPPEALVTALGGARPLEVARWRSLRPLDRYALCKSAAKPEKLTRAYDEIVGRAPGPLTHLSPPARRTW